MNILLTWLGIIVWVWIAIKVFTEFRYTLLDYGQSIYVGDSIIRTHQNLSILIAMLAASVSSLVAFIQYSSFILPFYAVGVWIPLGLLKLMFLYQCEIYRQERTKKFRVIGPLQLFIINLHRTDGKITEVDQG